MKFLDQKEVEDYDLFKSLEEKIKIINNENEKLFILNKENESEINQLTN